MNLRKNSISKTCIIHKNVKIGSNVKIHDYVVLYPGCVIKDNVEIFDHAVVGRSPKSSGCTARALKLNSQRTIISENCVVGVGAVIYQNVIVGRNSMLCDNCSIREQSRIGYNSIIGRNVCVNYNAKIGNYTKIMDNACITGNIVIGDHVFISMLVSTANDNYFGRTRDAVKKMSAPKIKDYVSIGEGATILPHILIDSYAVVAAGAVVTKNVKKHEVVFGVPAKSKLFYSSKKTNKK